MMDKLRSRWPKAFVVIVLASFFIQFGMGMHSTIVSIFMEGTLNFDGDQVGLVAGIREIPGLLTVFLALSALFFTESILGAICVFLASMGLLVMSRATGMTGLVIATLIYSTGIHLFFPVRNAMVLKVSHKEELASRLGQVQAVGALATLLAIAVARFLTPIVDIRFIFIFAGIFSSIGIVVFLMRRRGDEKVEKGSLKDLRKGMVFKLKYSSYYVLTLLSGSRGHITQTFAMYLLLREYDVSAETIITITFISTALSILTRPLLGRLVDRIGESKALTINYSMVLMLFLCYAFVKDVNVLFLVFVIDKLCIGFDVAITSHLGKIADPDDLKPSLAMGGTITHIMGILIPIVGGYMFKNLGYASTFVLGAVICGLSLLQAYRLPKADKSKASVSVQ